MFTGDEGSWKQNTLKTNEDEVYLTFPLMAVMAVLFTYQTGAYHLILRNIFSI